MDQFCFQLTKIMGRAGTQLKITKEQSVSRNPTVLSCLHSWYEHGNFLSNHNKQQNVHSSHECNAFSATNAIVTNQRIILIIYGNRVLSKFCSFSITNCRICSRCVTVVSVFCWAIPMSTACMHTYILNSLLMVYTGTVRYTLAATLRLIH